MKQLEDLLEMWRKDSDIDRTEPGKALLDIPKLHSKYLNILSHHRLLAKESEFKASKMRRLKWEYYTGKMSEEQLKELGWKPFELRILKQDVELYIESDTEIIQKKDRVFVQEEKVNYLESIIKMISNRQYHIRDAITWRKFINGES